jgi:hypothetical protein
MEHHPIANCLPLMDQEAYDQLKASIDQHGQRKPIITIGNLILAGRHRFRACQELKLPPIIREYDPERDGSHPAAYVIDEDLLRRHLSPGQRAAVHVELTKLIEIEVTDETDEAVPPVGAISKDPAAEQPSNVTDIKTVEKTTTKTTSGKTASEEDGAGKETAAKKLAKDAQASGVSEDSLKKAKQLLEGRPDLFDKVKNGKLSLHAAKQQMKAEDPAVSQERQEACDLMAEELGDEFGSAVRDGTLLPGTELKAFVACSVALRANIQELIVKGWSVHDAVKYHKGLYLKEDTIADLILRFNALGKATSKIVVEGFEITIKKAKPNQKG